MSTVAVRRLAASIHVCSSQRQYLMPDQTPPPLIKPFWRRGLAGFLDFVTVFFVGGYVIAKFTGETTSNGFELTGAPALIQFVVIFFYFYLGWEKLGGTIWQRSLKAK